MDCDSRVSQDWISLDYVPEELLKDASVCAGFLDVISLHFGEVIIKQDRDVILAGLEQDWEAITLMGMGGMGPNL